jgi:hypothetical protein
MTAGQKIPGVAKIPQVDPSRQKRRYGALRQRAQHMALSVLLITALKIMRLWAEVAAGRVAIDTLVHNFLVRTGILRRFNADGPACQSGGCADITQTGANEIDARQIQPAPRFEQHAIWRWYTENRLDVSNANRIKHEPATTTCIAKCGPSVIGSYCAMLMKASCRTLAMTQLQTGRPLLTIGTPERF